MSRLRTPPRQKDGLDVRRRRMTSKIRLRPQADSGFTEEERDGAGTHPERPLHDRSEASVNTLIERAKKLGYVTRDQVGAALTAEDVASEQIERVLASLSEMGIDVVEHQDADREDEKAEEPESQPADAAIVDVAGDPPAVAKASEPGDRTSDPVRMYLRDMQATQLLSREGEAAVARRIEVGREAMISGLCGSPLSFQAVVLWRDELTDGRASLRDIIDLEATYAGPGAKPKPAPAVELDRPTSAADRAR